jgi:hypothetical protein
MEDAARRYFEDPAAMSCPWVESPFFDRLLERADLSESDRRLARKFHDGGIDAARSICGRCTTSSTGARSSPA